MALVESFSGSLGHDLPTPSNSSFIQWDFPTLTRTSARRKENVKDLRSRLEKLDLSGAIVSDMHKRSTDEGTQVSHEMNPSKLTSTSTDCLSLPPRLSLTASIDGENASRNEGSGTSTRGPFHKWMRSIHRKASRRPALPSKEEWKSSSTGKAKSFGRTLLTPEFGRRHSQSESSSNFITAARSTTASFASVSVLARSRKHNTALHHHSKTDLSSKASLHTTRFSEDSIQEVSSAIDLEATQRAIRRRQILEELIKTEESHAGDMRLLIHVYKTILVSFPNCSDEFHASVGRNLGAISELHEAILGELYRTVPNSEYTQLDCPKAVIDTEFSQTSRRWTIDHQSKDRTHLIQHVPGIASEPSVAAEVARIFAKKMHEFFIYQEYGAKYEKMMQDINATSETMSNWEAYQKGFERLATTFSSTNTQSESPRKSLTLNDLLIKPLQRVCKYPLLLKELLSSTPSKDCPISNMEINNTLMRIRETTNEINQATGDDKMKETLEKTWRLQDRLVFSNCAIDSVSKARLRSFGTLKLCGSLHGCWNSSRGIIGQYFICLLYRDLICLALPSKSDAIHTIEACINLHESKMEEVDDNRAPHSWKLVFECDSQLYEIMMTACSAAEESEWRKSMSQYQNSNDSGTYNPSVYSFLEFDIESLGPVFGKTGSIARKISIRTATAEAKTPLCHVILKGTSNMHDEKTKASAGGGINRSLSLLAANSRVAVLTPARNERFRIETLLSDVWSRDVLPFLSITARSRSEQLLGTSALSLMRKISTASFTKASKKSIGIRYEALEKQRAESLGRSSIGQKSYAESTCGDGTSRPVYDRSMPYHLDRFVRPKTDSDTKTQYSGEGPETEASLGSRTVRR